MQPVNKEEIERIRDEAIDAGKDASELEKILKFEKLPETPMGEIKTKDIRKDVWMRMEGMSEKKRTQGKIVIMSTGPAKEEDFE
jgi:hypothetical protein